MTIRKGSPYGTPGAEFPSGGVVVATDAGARDALEQARRAGVAFPPIGLLGGDLCRTLGGRGDEQRLRGGGAVAFPVDLGQVLVDGRLHLFVAHVVARDRSWRRVVAAMNAQWLGAWNVGPRAHPNDGLVDVYDARLTLRDLPKVRSRLPAGAHLPHPRIEERRSPAVPVELERPLAVWIDGQRVERGRVLSLRVEPDALTVYV